MDTPAAGVGTELGPFRVDAELGRGGMGVVFRAIQVGLNRPVALKLLTPNADFGGELRERFEAEARLAARVRHPAIVQVLDFGVLSGGQPYIAYELVEGKPLSALIASGPLDACAARTIALDVVGAIAALHEAGIVHRDLKPSNVLVDSTGHARVTDLGIAVEVTARVRRTAPGMLLGTPEFVAPELLREQEPTAAADVYSAGVLMFLLATGQLPFQSDSLAELLRAHIQDTPPEATALRVQADPLLSRLARSALAKEPAARPTARELLDALTREAPLATVALAREPSGARRVAAKPSSQRGVARPPARSRNLRAIAVGAVVALAIGAGVGIATRSPREARVPPLPVTSAPATPAPPVREVEPLTGRWRRVTGLLSEMTGSLVGRDRAMKRCKQLTGLDMEAPGRWVYWVELSRWMEEGKANDPLPEPDLELGSTLYHMVDAQGDEHALIGTVSRGIFSKGGPAAEGEALAFAVVCVGTEPQDARGWLLLARSYDLDGRTALAVKAYSHALTRGKPPGGPNWVRQMWFALARALTLVPGHSLEREFWNWVPKVTPIVLDGLKDACDPEVYERVMRARR